MANPTGTEAAPAAASTTSGSSAAAANASQDVKSTKAATPASAAPPADRIADTPGEAALLVSEFPPPPHYYRRASIDAATGRLRIKPPKIPREALARGTRRAKAAAERARAEAEAERLRQGEESAESMMMCDDKTGAILGGVASTSINNDDDDDGNDDDVVAVFGEIVEDPMLVEPLDSCDDPTVVRDEVKRLNEQVLQLFVTLVQDLVHRPAENKKTRDELSHTVFLMLQECNKFREHQAREVLIDLLEKQLSRRERLAKELERCVDEADQLLLRR